MSKKLAEIAVGDFVLRWFGGIPKPMRLKVTQLTADRIICGAWEFDRQTGAEIDEDLGWGLGVSPVHFLNLNQARTRKRTFGLPPCNGWQLFWTLAKYSGTEERALPKPCGGD